MKDFSQSLRSFDVNNPVRASGRRAVLDELLSKLSEDELVKAQNHTACHPSEYLIVDLDGISPRLRLEAGQHRRAAILKMIGIGGGKVIPRDQQ